jgi:hypothetical protein
LADLSSTERAILMAAQTFVDDWLHDGRRGPFLRSVRQAAKAWARLHDYSTEHQRAFIRVARAIRVGHGNAAHRPEPLLDIVRFNVLDDWIE